MSLKNLGSITKNFSGIREIVTTLNSFSGIQSIGNISQIMDVFKSMNEVEKGTVAFQKFFTVLKGFDGSEIGIKKLAESFNGISLESAKAILGVSGLNEVQMQAILINAGLSPELAATTAAEIAAGNAATGAAGGFAAFTASVKAAAKGLATFLLTNPVGWAILAAGAIFGVVKAYDALTVSAEEAAEKMEESFAEFEEAQQKVSDLNSELETTRDNIKELEAKGGLTFVEQSELEKLRESVRLLEIQADLAEKEAAREAKEAAADTVYSYEKNFKHAISSDETNSYINSAISSGNNAGLLSDSSNISSMIAGIKQFETLRDEATNEEDWTHYTETIQEATDLVWEQANILADYQSKLEAIPDAYLTDEQRGYLKEIKSSIEYIYQELDPAKWKQIKLDEILNRSNFADAKQELLDMAKASDNVGVSASDVKSYFLLSKALESAGISAQEFADVINSEAGIIDYDAVKNQIKDQFSLSDKITSLTGSERKKYLNEFNSWLNTLSEDQLAIVYEVYCNTDTAEWSLQQWQEAVDIMTEEISADNKVLYKSYSELNAAVKSAMAAQQVANDVFSNNTYITEDAYNSIVELIGGETALADCIDTSNGYLVTNAEALNKLIDSSNDALRKNVKLAKSNEKLKYHELTKQLQDVVSNMDDYGDSASDVVKTLLDQIDATELQIAKYALLEQQLLGVTNAFTKLDDAKAVDEAADYTDDLSDMIESLFSAYENKEFGTETFWTAFEALVPEDVYGKFEDIGDQIDAGWKYLNKTIGKYYTKDKDGISIDFKNVKSFVKAGLSKGYGDSTVFTGSLDSFELNDSITTIEELADAMGVTTEVAFALGNAISKYSADNTDFLDSLSVNTLEGKIYATDQKLVELLAHRAQLAESGEIDTEEWNEVQTAISGANSELEKLANESRKDISQHIELDSNITEIQALVDDLYSKLQEMDETNPDYSDTMSNYLVAQQQLATLLEDKYALETPTELTIQLALEQVQGEIDTAQDKLDEIATFDGEVYTAIAGVEQHEVDDLVAKIETLRGEQANIQMYAGIDDEDVLNSLETIQNYAIEDKKFSVTANLGSTISRLQKVADMLDGITDKTVTVTTNIRTNNTTSINDAYRNKTDKILGIGEFAGTAHVRGKCGIKSSEKDSLVGELGTELYVDPRTGTYQTVGENGAEFVDLPRGAIIFNHKQTEGLLKNKRINSRGKAYLNGNAHFTLIDTTYKSPSSSTTGSTSSKTSGSNDSSDDAIDWIEIAIERVERVIERMSAAASSAYKTLKERLGATSDEISFVTKEIEIQEKAYTRYIQEANSVGLSSDLAELVQNGAIDIGKYDEKTQKLIEDYQNWYNKALECSDAVQDLHENLAELYEDRFNSIRDDFDNQLELLEHLTNTYDNGIDRLEAQGYLESTKYYAALQDVERQNIAVLNNELIALKKSFSEAMNSGEIAEGSESWYAMQSAINDVKEQIDEANTSLLDYAKTMRELEWEYFDFAQDRISQLTNESDFLIDLMSNSNLHTDKGQLTDEGMATMGLHGQNYNTYMAQSDAYAQEILRINKQIAEDPYNTDLIERREELLGLQQDSILAAEDEKQAIIDLVREGIDLELESLQDLIDTYSEALDSAKDLYDYQRKIADHTDEISSLEKQLSAYAENTSEETRAKIQKIQVDLQNAREDLEETEYERYISDQKKLLDNLYTEYESILNQRLDDVDALLEEMIGTINVNTDSINSTLVEVSENVGYTMTDNMQSIWNGAVESIDGTISIYGDGFSEKLTSINDVLSQINSNIAGMISSSDEQAEEAVNNTEQVTTPDVVVPPTTSPNEPEINTTPTTAATPQTTTKAITIGGKINAKGAKIYSHAGATSGSNQYYKNDPIYTVLDEKNGYLMVRYHKLSSGVTGWFKKSDVKAYKTGGLVNYTGLAKLDGTPTKPELVLNASDTANFIELKDALRSLANQDISLSQVGAYNVGSVSHANGIIDTNSLLAIIRSQDRGDTTNSIGDINITIPIEHVSDYNDFVNQLRNDSKFEKMVQAMTIDPLVKKSKLAKYNYKW